MYKFTEDGKGPMHLRFFTVLIDKQKVERPLHVAMYQLSLCNDCLLAVLGKVS